MIQMYYKDILEAFERENIQYLLVGGISAVLYGVPRMTQDIDFIISTEKENITKILSILASFDFIPRLPVDPIGLINENTRKEWIEERNLKAFSFNNRLNPYKVVDILLVHNLDFSTSYKNRTELTIWGISINLVSINDLINMKEYAGREKDLSDVQTLKAIIERRNKK